MSNADADLRKRPTENLKTPPMRARNAGLVQPLPAGRLEQRIYREAHLDMNRRQAGLVI
jgi:hypothetical protein